MSGLGSQYEIIQKLGEGGMGTVYLAKDTMIDRLVAIKQLHRNTGSEEESLGERFQAEALALAKLNNPNVTHLYSFIPKEDTYWMIMEYVEGKTLEDWLFVHKKITHQLAASITVQILDGLHHAHRKGIIHRDIKPANVMINEDGEVKIMDFGIARMRNAQRITSHGKSVGTLEYMAPEQIQGHEGDERTDIYAVGNILYEMLCGTTPFQSDTDYILMKDKLEKQPESILRENPTVPESLEKIIFKALQRNPNKRYQTARELKSAIEKCLDGTLLDQFTLSKVLKASQVFTAPEKGNEIISVSNILSRAKSISGRFRVPSAGKFKVPTVGKINRSYLILGASVLLCLILLIWSGGTEVSKTDEIPETPVVTWEEPADEPEQDMAEQSSGNFDETPSEMYRRIAKPTEVKAKPKEEKNNVKKSVNNTTDNKPSNTPQQTELSENINKERTVPNTPAEVPSGKSILVTLQEDLSSEEKERDGKLIRLTCNEDVLADNRVIIRKGSTVTGKIVDCVPSNSKKKALIGFVIIRVEAVDGSTVKLKSKRFRLFADVPGKAISYRSGQTFEAILQRGIVK
ncbi:serine/threonine protein kinase [Aequorivita antarctica]|uniref:non-specific serine/threonine protein kinase n=1 Tax=Aequorivita antarctica TaxID=153266 RepID=A0A5C6YW16_9FLAO|nr:serine/threonine-protein kinase [Aequorivita antarctica]TXD71391.1 serine/threonine protein kinase [Aequorivita antarctica]SRX76406.1 Serine/threonine-protein kinase PrkC [Aequorivita antarctica]